MLYFQAGEPDSDTEEDWPDTPPLPDTASPGDKLRLRDQEAQLLQGYLRNQYNRQIVSVCKIFLLIRHIRRFPRKIAYSPFFAVFLPIRR